MAARKNRGTKEHPWHDVVKNRTRASMIKNELVKHMLGTRQMTPTQVSAAKIVLDRLEPTLAAVEHTGELTQTYVAMMPSPVEGMTDWTKQHMADTEPAQPIDKTTH